MKTKRQFIAAALCGAGALAISLVSCKKETPKPQPEPEPTITAQSFMIDVQGIKEYIIKGNEVWHFDELAAAKAEFGYDQCAPETGGPDNGNQCRAKALNDAKEAKCAFWNQTGRPYWKLFHTNVTGDTSAAFSLTTVIAGESFMKGGQFTNKGKYSFTLLNPDNSSRITNLQYSINDGTPVSLSHTVVPGNSSTNNCWLNLVYNANCGPYGKPEAFSFLKTGTTIGDILRSDDHPGNDDGCSAAAIGMVEPLNLKLSAGTHTLTFSANVKGNEGQADVRVTRAVKIHISAESCSN